MYQKSLHVRCAIEIKYNALLKSFVPKFEFKEFIVNRQFYIDN